MIITFNELRRIKDRLPSGSSPDGGVVTLDDTTILDVAMRILSEQ